MATSKLFSFLFLQLIMSVLVVLHPANGQGLKVGFYANTCPEAEAIVKKVIVQTLSKAPTLAAPLLRMHFHDCFVRVRIIYITDHDRSIILHCLIFNNCNFVAFRSFSTHWLC
jgi:hypothetical protein